MPKLKPHSVSVVVLDDVVPSDFASPLDILGRATTADGERCYDVRLCSVSNTVRTEYFSIDTRHSIRSLGNSDTIIVPGTQKPDAAIPPQVRRALRRAYENDVRIASICTGAFILADAGLLNGKRATTHWLAAENLANRYPHIDVDPNVLFVDNGQVLTSAGAMAGIDLCLHLIRHDFGPAVAAQSARKAVVPLARQGGQAQFIDPGPPSSGSGSLDALFVWIENNLSRQLDVPQLADQAALSVRTLHRKFLEQTGSTPNAWVQQTRIRAAQKLLEESEFSIDKIAAQTGFGSSANFRSRFKSIVGTSPTAYRNAFTNPG